MHPNADTITKFYAAFAQLDPDTMAACYADDVRFDDEVFSPARQGADHGHVAHAVRGHARQGPGRLEAGSQRHRGRRQTGRAHWDAHYRFSATGRLVLNRIDAASPSTRRA
jgi:ketosteroid isomerase-like protein